MSAPAKVHSSEAIEAVRMALISFIEQVSDALTELSAEMRRDAGMAGARSARLLEECRFDWAMRQGARSAAGSASLLDVSDRERAAQLYEERAELKKAQARLAYCEQKTDRVRHWQQTMRHELFEYEGRISQLVRLVEIEVPQSIGVLNKIMRNLEEYHAVRAADPKASYDDVAMAKAIWAEKSSTNSSANAAAADEKAATDKKNGKDAESSGDVSHPESRSRVNGLNAE